MEARETVPVACGRSVADQTSQSFGVKLLDELVDRWRLTEECKGTN